MSRGTESENAVRGVLTGVLSLSLILASIDGLPAAYFLILAGVSAAAGIAIEIASYLRARRAHRPWPGPDRLARGTLFLLVLVAGAGLASGLWLPHDGDGNPSSARAAERTYASRVNEVLADLREKQRQLYERWENATSPSRQEMAAAKLRKAFALARRSLAGIQPPRSARTAHHNLLAALGDGRDAYRSLARAVIRSEERLATAMRAATASSHRLAAAQREFQLED